MPIRPHLRPLYPPDWPAISRAVRFERAGGRCEQCGSPHGAVLRRLPDGRISRVVLAAAHLDHDPRNNRPGNLRALCQRCHLLHDRAHHLAERRMTYRRRYAIADLFDGLIPPRHPSPASPDRGFPAIRRA